MFLHQLLTDDIACAPLSGQILNLKPFPGSSTVLNPLASTSGVGLDSTGPDTLLAYCSLITCPDWCLTSLVDSSSSSELLVVSSSSELMKMLEPAKSSVVVGSDKNCLSILCTCLFPLQFSHLWTVWPF